MKYNFYILKKQAHEAKSKPVVKLQNNASNIIVHLQYVQAKGLGNDQISVSGKYIKLTEFVCLILNAKEFIMV